MVMTAGLFGRQEGRKLSTSARTKLPDQRIALGHGLPEVALLSTIQTAGSFNDDEWWPLNLNGLALPTF